MIERCCRLAQLLSGKDNLAGNVSRWLPMSPKLRTVVIGLACGLNVSSPLLQEKVIFGGAVSYLIVNGYAIQCSVVM